jgi:hypothetical protein
VVASKTASPDLLVSAGTSVAITLIRAVDGLID